MFSRTILDAAAAKARKFGVTTGEKGCEPLQGSKLHSQKNEFPESREELIATAITDWERLSNIRSVKPNREVKAELLFEGGKEVEKAEYPLAFGKHEEARKYLSEKSNWRRIVFVSPYSKAKTLWIVHQDEKPEKAFTTISNFIAEAEGVAHQGEEWALSLTNEATFDPIKLIDGKPDEEESEVTRNLQAIVAVKDLQRAIEANGEEWLLSRKGSFKRLRKSNEEDNEDCAFGKKPWYLSQIWSDWADLRNEGIEDKWTAVNEAKTIGKGFWATLAVEKVRSNIARAKADYERANFEDRDWLVDIMEAGMEELHTLTAGISSIGLSPEKMAAKIAKTRSIFPIHHEKSTAKNGWITLKESESSEWTKTRPGNHHNWLCDMLGDWQAEDSQAPVQTPLTRLLTTIILDLTFRQLRTQTRKTLGAKCQSVSMQWNINQGRLSDRAFIQKWVKRTIEKCQEPVETTKIEIIGKGQNHKIIWIPGKRDSQLWVFNIGENIKRKHFMQLTRMAKHLRLHGQESEALNKLAEKAWTQENVNECLEAFNASRNHVENDVILLKRSGPAPTIRQLLRTIEAMTAEAKKQAPSSSSKLASVLINLTGGWSWAAGGHINFIQQPQEFLEAWMANRFKLTAPPQQPRKKKAERKLPKSSIASEEWAKRTIEVNNRMEEALKEADAYYEGDKMQIEDFYSEEAAWKASVSATGGEVSQLKAYLSFVLVNRCFPF
ncbi:unnamed protein product [Oikopleura dioica]|uniref:Uncharacterized protein n=1 Tax=Oikopleura dioica TaxID=34765 RepID=E4X6C1_OIKDI|nr:unnamed protein product [Oikopleura dioica]